MDGERQLSIETIHALDRSLKRIEALLGLSALLMVHINHLQCVCLVFGMLRCAYNGFQKCEPIYAMIDPLRFGRPLLMFVRVIAELVSTAMDVLSWLLDVAVQYITSH